MQEAARNCPNANSAQWSCCFCGLEKHHEAKVAGYAELGIVPQRMQRDLVASYGFWVC